MTEVIYYNTLMLVYTLKGKQYAENDSAASVCKLALWTHRTLADVPRETSATPVSICLQALLSNEVSEIGNTIRIAPLVVVPSNHLDHVPTQHHRRETIDNCRVCIATEV